MGDLLFLAILIGLVAWKWRPKPTARPAAQGAMGPAEARAVLGVGPQAGEREIRAAHARLIRLAHPDRGGAHGLAAQLNRARDVLLKG
jgi:hypothetical protein